MRSRLEEIERALVLRLRGHDAEPGSEAAHRRQRVLRRRLVEEELAETVPIRGQAEDAREACAPEIGVHEDDATARLRVDEREIDCGRRLPFAARRARDEDRALARRCAGRAALMFTRAS